MSVPANAMAASMAFNQAVQDAGDFIDQKFSEYGWQFPTGAGGYSSMAAGDAFDPNLVLTFDDQGKVTQNLPSVAAGQYGTTGLFAQAAQQAAGGEAETMAATRMAGLRGGLARQRQEAAEFAGQQQMGQLSGTLFSAIQGQYGGVGQAYRDYLVAKTTDATSGAQTSSESAPTTSTPPPEVPPVITPPPPPIPEPVSAPAPAQAPAPEKPFASDIPPNSVGSTPVPPQLWNLFNVQGNPTGSNKPVNPPNGTIFKGAGGVPFIYKNGKWFKRG